MDDDDCCVCCDAFCEAICGPDDDECCEPCFSWMPGCERDATPDCMGVRWCVRRDCCGVLCATLVRPVSIAALWGGAAGRMSGRPRCAAASPSRD